MALMDTTAVAYQLKRVYGDKITDLFARQTMTYNMFMKSGRKATMAPAGVGYYFAVRQSDNEAVGARAENAYIPEPLDTDGVQGTILPRLMYGTLRMSGLAMEVGKTNIQSFVNVQGDAIANIYKALIVDLNRQCWGDGFGLLGTLSAAATPDTTGTWTGTFSNDRGIRYIRKGMLVDFYNDGAIDESSSPSRVFSINPVTKVVTFERGDVGDTYRVYHPIVAARSYTDGEAAIASGSFMVRMGARLASHATTDAGYEFMGLNGMFDDGTLITTFEGINTTNDPEFVANILDNSAVNRELSLDLMLQAMDLSATRSGVRPNRILTGLGQRRKYFALLANDVRYAPGKFLGGYESLAFAQDGQVQMVFDPAAQPNRMYFYPDGVIQKYELTPIGWGGFDSNKMHWREMYDQATMYLRTYANLGVEHRNALTLLDDLTEPSSLIW